MHIVMGATGRVGGSVADSLLDRGEPVTVVTRDARRAQRWRERGAVVAVADVHDREALRDVMRRGRRAFVLMPPADPSGDSVAEERRTVSSLVAALDGVALEQIVVQSTYGAQPGDAIGDLGVLWTLEQGLATLDAPVLAIRAAYFMSNWEAAIGPARDHGTCPTVLPEDLVLPMVAPVDIGRIAARVLMATRPITGIHEVEGPARYTPRDVARALGEALGRDVAAVAVPREQWVTVFEDMGFSPTSARSYAAMTALAVDRPYLPAAPERGTTTLEAYIAGLVRTATEHDRRD